ncbi:TPA: glycosyltransferase [Escherichia coli]|nr:glycosyltransferase [Escherichia coli]QSI07726.1 glycosyltransferase [Escherichia coli]HAJ2533534.1 glycosyltransferase [Escherichia coli]
MTYGEHAKELMVLSGIKESSISVIYNSLNVKQQEQFYEKLDNLSVDNLLDYHFDKTKTNIVFVGRLTKVKKIDLIFEALAKLGNRNYKLIIIGNGPEETHLKQAVKKLNLISMVTFMGEIHDESILSWLIYNSDICISPGNVGLTAMHSLVYGTPVITNNDFCHQMPEYEAIDEEKNGGFFEANNIESLAQKIEEWSNKILTTDRGLLRNECRKPILLKYNPKNQAQLIWECITKNVK